MDLAAKQKSRFALTIMHAGQVVHFSTHGTMMKAEKQFKRLTGLAWAEFKRGTARAAHLIGSEIRKVSRDLAKELERRFGGLELKFGQLDEKIGLHRFGEWKERMGRSLEMRGS